MRKAVLLLALAVVAPVSGKQGWQSRQRRSTAAAFVPSAAAIAAAAAAAVATAPVLPLDALEPASQQLQVAAMPQSAVTAAASYARAPTGSGSALRSLLLLGDAPALPSLEAPLSAVQSASESLKESAKALREKTNKEARGYWTKGRGKEVIDTLSSVDKVAAPLAGAAGAATDVVAGYWTTGRGADILKAAQATLNPEVVAKAGADAAAAAAAAAVSQLPPPEALVPSEATDAAAAAAAAVAKASEDLLSYTTKTLQEGVSSLPQAVDATVSSTASAVTGVLGQTVNSIGATLSRETDITIKGLAAAPEKLPAALSGIGEGGAAVVTGAAENAAKAGKVLGDAGAGLSRAFSAANSAPRPWQTGAAAGRATAVTVPSIDPAAVAAAADAALKSAAEAAAAATATVGGVGESLQAAATKTLSGAVEDVASKATTVATVATKAATDATAAATAATQELPSKLQAEANTYLTQGRGKEILQQLEQIQSEGKAVDVVAAPLTGAANFAAENVKGYWTSGRGAEILKQLNSVDPAKAAAEVAAAAAGTLGIANGP